MSSQTTIELLEDPTRTRYLENQWAARILSKLEEVEGTLLAQPDINAIYNYLDAIAKAEPEDEDGVREAEETWSFLYFAMFHSPLIIRLFVERGYAFATSNVRLLSSAYSQLPEFHGLSTPAEYELYNNSLIRNNEQFTNIAGLTRGWINDILAKGLSLVDTRNLIQKTFKISKVRSEMIARTETLNSFNEAARDRYAQFGIKHYMFISHSDACTDAKQLSDGTIVKGGCIELHGKIYPISDSVHQPPIHPNGRCTILPIMI